VKILISEAMHDTAGFESRHVDVVYMDLVLKLSLIKLKPLVLNVLK
jgi:hypothetical protein